MGRKEIWALTLEEAADRFRTHLTCGLAKEEARRRLAQEGRNALPAPPRKAFWHLFFSQLKSPLIWVLLVAALLSGLLSRWIEMQTILGIVLLNACVGFFQEFRAQKAFEALKQLLIPKSKVIRDEMLHEIPSVEIVPGDLVLLESGDHVPADGRLVYCAQFATQEAVLTGESLSVHKKITPLEDQPISLAERKNCVYLGTEAVSGKALFIVTATGLGTEVGKIASMLQEESEKQTPLQARLNHLSRNLILFCLCIVVFLLFFGVSRGESWGAMILMSLSLAVAAIPEGLPAIVTIALAIGVQRMAKRNALIRRLSSVETLGCSSVICADKTGTITKGEMVVRKVWAQGDLFDVEGLGYEPRGGFSKEGRGVDPNGYPELLLALRIGVLCNQAELVEAKEGWKIVGDPTEGALLTAAAKAGVWKETLEEAHPIIGELPFESERRRMSVLRSPCRLYVKGAPDEILRLSKGTPFQSEIEQRIAEFAAAGMRVLGMAYRDLQTKELSVAHESDLVFVGLVGMIDPPRPGVKEAIAQCLEAHVRPIMVTGDHKQTAIAIAKEVGLMREDQTALDGNQIDQLDAAALEETVHHTAVYARASAYHKLRIINALQKSSEVVAMTGDGVNDAPAVASADIGISMGIAGSDVTRKASDMVLLDDHFATIVAAVEEGRHIYDNILKFTLVLFATNFGELFSILLGIVFGFQSEGHAYWIALLPQQILWVNIVTGGFPAVALSFDPILPESMYRPPRKLDEPIIPTRRGVQLVIVGIVIGLITTTAARIGFTEGPVHGQTMAFTSLVLSEFGIVCLAHMPLSLASNPKLLVALSCSLFLQLLITYVPGLQKAFGTTALGLDDWGILIGLFSVGFLIHWTILKVGKRSTKGKGT